MFNYKGNVFSDLDELANVYDLTFGELMERIQLSSTGVVTLREGYYGIRKSERYLFEKKTYASLEDIAKEFDVSYVTFLTRTRISDRGEVKFKRRFNSFDKSVLAVDNVLPVYLYAGKEYTGIENLSEVSGVSLNKLMSIVKGMHDQDVTDVIHEYLKSIRKLKVVDEYYVYVKDVVEAFSVSRGSVDYFLRKGYSVEGSIIHLLDKGFLGKEYERKAYMYENEMFRTVTELFDRVGKLEDKSFLKFVYDMRAGVYVDRIYYREMDMDVRYEWDGNTYDNLKEVAIVAGVKEVALAKKLRETGSLPEALTFLLNVKKPKYVINGVYFNTLNEIADHLKMTLYVFRKDILLSGMVKKLDKDGNYVRFYG